MNNIINKMEEILKKHLKPEKHNDVDLSDYENHYRDFYFDYLSKQSAKEAIMLFPNSERLYTKYCHITEGYPNVSVKMSDQFYKETVTNYLKNSLLLMNKNEDDKAYQFLLNFKEVQIVDKKPNFETENNKLHMFAYGAITEFTINHLPEEDHFDIIYSWSYEKTHWGTMPAYLLEDYMENDVLNNCDFFLPAFFLWLGANSNNYWAKDNSLDSDIVFFCPTTK